jgi:hypothetical protein
MSGNGKFTLEFDISDIPMLVDAMSLASATALMYGGRNNGICDRFQMFQQMLEEHSPIPGKYRDEGYKWYLACTAAYRAKNVEVAFLASENHRSFLGSPEGRVSILVDGKIFPVTEQLKQEDAPEIMSNVVSALEAMIEPNTRLLRRVSGTAVVEAGAEDEKDVLSAAVAEVLNHHIDGFGIECSHVHEVERNWRSTASDDLLGVRFQVAVPHYLADQVDGKDFDFPDVGMTPGV